MDPLIVALLLGAALLHVTWHVILKTAGDPLVAATIGVWAATAVLVPVAVVGWAAVGRPTLPLAVLGVAGLSGAIETVYFILLSAAYRRGDLSVVYPTARGTAPLLAVLAGVLVFHERLDAAGAIGVAALLGGILVLQRPWRLVLGEVSGSDRAATLFALGTGVAIAGYTTVDREGARLVAPWLYAALIWPAMGIGLLGWRVVSARSPRRSGAVLVAGTGDLDLAIPASPTVPARSSWSGRLAAPARSSSGRPGPPVRSARAEVGRSVVAGWLTIVSYGVVLYALSVAPLSVVAPLRESAIVLASAFGALQLREAAGRRDAVRRVVAAGLVVGGIGLLVLEG